MIVPFETLTLAFVAAVVLAFMPGSDNRVPIHGYGNAAVSFYTLGLCFVLLVVTVAAAFGAAMLPRGATVVIAFTTLNTTWGLVRMPGRQPSKSSSQPSSINDASVLSVLVVKPAPPSNGTLFRWGLAVNASSPKVAILFLTFMPLTDSDRGPAAGQILLLGAAFISATALIFGLFPNSVGYVGMTLNASMPDEVTMNRITAALLVLLTIRMFVTVL
jgi:threonine/homoserine/homoserine lactone efflux protein